MFDGTTVKRASERRGIATSGMLVLGVLAGLPGLQAEAAVKRWRITKTIAEEGFLDQGPSRWTLNGSTVGNAFTGDEDRWMPGSITALFWTDLMIDDHHDEFSSFSPGSNTGQGDVGLVPEPRARAGGVDPLGRAGFEHRRRERDIALPSAQVGGPGGPDDPVALPTTHHVYDFYWQVGYDCFRLPLYVHPTESMIVAVEGTFEVDSADPWAVISIDESLVYEGLLSGFDPAIHGLEVVGDMFLQEEFCLGDVTGDLVVAAEDIRLILDHIGYQDLPQYDLDSDDQITFEDARIAIEALGTTCVNPCATTNFIPIVP
ncbi:MAG: hypothetical protein AB8G96_10030 [Phycisphaerales bacterium]